jgi:hypothetical protein
VLHERLRQCRRHRFRRRPMLPHPADPWCRPNCVLPILLACAVRDCKPFLQLGRMQHLARRLYSRTPVPSPQQRCGRRWRCCVALHSTFRGHFNRVLAPRGTSCAPARGLPQTRHTTLTRRGLRSGERSAPTVAQGLWRRVVVTGPACLARQSRLHCVNYTRTVGE